MHMFSKEKNFYGGHGIVGAQVSLGTGLAFANRYRGNDNVSLAYFGDGAANQGQVYESFNMAALWKLPVIYIVENNRYAMGTSAAARLGAVRFLAARRRASAFPASRSTAWTCAPSRPPATRPSSIAAPARVRSSSKCMTYRYRGHSMSDPAKYRSKDEVQKMRSEHDPIEQVKARLLEKGWASEDDLKAIDKDVRDIVADSADFAQADPEPDVSELYTDILL